MTEIDTHTRLVETPLGTCRLSADRHGLRGARIDDTPSPGPGRETTPAEVAAHLERAAQALESYFAGHRRDFGDLALRPQGTEFQRRVWDALQTIPFGETRSYGDIARAIDSPGAARAVGMANHHNPLWILIPCHRVVGQDGRLTGYRGGLDRKAWLLEHEGAGSAQLSL